MEQLNKLLRPSSPVGGVHMVMNIVSASSARFDHASSNRFYARIDKANETLACCEEILPGLGVT